MERSAYMHLIIDHRAEPKIVGADIMSDRDPTHLGEGFSTIMACAKDGDTYEEARQNLCSALDNKHTRWLLDLWRKTGRQ